MLLPSLLLLRVFGQAQECPTPILAGQPPPIGNCYPCRFPGSPAPPPDAPPLPECTNYNGTITSTTTTRTTSTTSTTISTTTTTAPIVSVVLVTPAPQSSDGPGITSLQLAGIICGTVIFLALIIVVAVYVLKKRNAIPFYQQRKQPGRIVQVNNSQESLDTALNNQPYTNTAVYFERAQ
ncbi:hypothetical protein EDD86DRAFT_198557 [Gorgonomyces haynaldii]|nr:hypothetical protein EDD86DRAFT_198557 [Gorgonomyces haynaldii]